MCFLGLKIVKMTLSDAQNLTVIFDLRGHISAFRVKSTPKSVTFKAKNNAQTTSEQL